MTIIENFYLFFIKKIYVVFIVSIFFCNSSLAEPQEQVDSGMDAFEDLLSVLSKETDIATKTKMNIDFVPGMVTVLHGKDLVSKGVLNVFEALKLVPGIDASVSGDGQQQLIVRGIGKLFGSGKVKVLVNGVPFNSTFTAQVTLTSIPTEQVERIEVVRGPGSAIYGEFAYAGVIDIITKDSSNEVYARYGGLNSRVVGGMYSRKSEEHGYSVSLNVSSSKSNPDDIFSGQDALFGTPLQPISNSPGPVNDNDERNSYMFKFDYKGMSFIAEKLDRGFGNYFGADNRLPEPDAGIVRRGSYEVYEFSMPLKIIETADTSVKLGWAKQEFQATNQMLFPDGFQGQFPDGVLSTPHYEEEKFYAGLELHFEALKGHDVVAGIDLAYINQGDTFIARNFAPNPAPPPLLVELPATQVFTGAGNWLSESNNRAIIGMFVQDQYAVTEKFNLVAGLRFDDYDDVGNSVTPRVATIYRLSDDQTVKFQYAEAFRPPTFIELYSQNNPIVNGNSDLSAETIKSYEVGYVFNDGLTIGRVTVFTAELEDLIDEGVVAPPASVTFQNIGKASQNGVELEFVRQLTHNFKLDSNVSYVDVKDDLTGQEFPNIANVLANVGMVFQPKHDNSINIQYRYTGKRKRDPLDTRSTLSAYHAVDITGTIFHFLVKNLTFRAGVKNMFDEEVLMPAPPNTYANDYPQPGRELWLSVGYKL